MRQPLLITALALAAIAVAGCATGKSSKVVASAPPVMPTDEYVIGPGDTVQVFVWQHPEVSVSIPVRPDGRISTPLVEDMQAVGKTPSGLARDIEVALGEYIRSPKVNVIVSGFVGTFSTQVRVVGQAASPQAIPFRQELSVLDVMIQVGGLGPNAAGNRAKIVRRIGNIQEEIPVRLDDLLNKGKISANVPMRPGDVLIIPESRL
ncbi:MAG: XrtA/PEP-CTERM system exopolysaccharide export protein [Gammaproteobacteria bacterium]